MKKSKLKMMNFMALCCVLGMISKKLMNPFANIVTDLLHIPGGVSTAFSIMFLVIGREYVSLSHGGTLMATVQGLLALALGRVGSMGILMPFGFIVTGIGIDLVYALKKIFSLSMFERMVFSNALAAVAASVFANIIVFQLRGSVLYLYLCVSAISGTLFGILGYVIYQRIQGGIS